MPILGRPAGGQGAWAGRRARLGSPTPLHPSLRSLALTSRRRSHSPAEGDEAKGVAPLILHQARAELRQPSEEEAKGDGQLDGAGGLGQLGLGALQQRGGEREAVEAQGRCREAGRGAGEGVGGGGDYSFPQAGLGGGACARPCRGGGARQRLVRQPAMSVCWGDPRRGEARCQPGSRGTPHVPDACSLPSSNYRHPGGKTLAWVGSGGVDLQAIVLQGLQASRQKLNAVVLHDVQCLVGPGSKG